MSFPSQTDFPDPPLDNSGELQLSGDLQFLADRLRREAVVIAEAQVPQSAAATLLRHAATGDKRQTWRQVALACALATVCASCAAIGLILHHAAELARPLPARHRPHLETYYDGPLSSARPEVDTSVFLSASGPNGERPLQTDLAAAADSLTTEQRIELLENTLEHYRNALTVHHERVVELEAMLKAANDELARMRRANE